MTPRKRGGRLVEIQVDITGYGSRSVVVPGTNDKFGVSGGTAGPVEITMCVAGKGSLDRPMQDPTQRGHPAVLRPWKGRITSARRNRDSLTRGKRDVIRIETDLTLGALFASATSGCCLAVDEVGEFLDDDATVDLSIFAPVDGVLGS